jgi:CelD/BcsL family acetyltransferase involved in cellulose biosynthesis
MNFTLHTHFPDYAIATEWNALLAESITNAPFLRYEYLAQWWKTRGGGEWQHASLALMTAHEQDRLIGIAPLFRAANRAGETALLLLGSIEISDQLDLIARPGDLPNFLSGLLDRLGSDYPETWSALDWYNLPDSSATLAALKAESAKRGWSYHEEIYEPTPYIPLPGDYEAYLAGIDKKQRHEIRRKVRRAEESGRGVRWYIVEDESRLEAEMDGFIALMALDPNKCDFLIPPMSEQMKAMAHAAFREGWLQLALLEVDGEKACGYLNFDYAGRIWVYNSGLDRRFMDLSPGWVLLAYLLQWATEQGRSEFDFLRGNEDYKYKFGGRDRFAMRAVVRKP